MALWYPGAVRRDGPAGKVQSLTNTASGAVLHSMVGYRSGAHSVLDNVAPPRETIAWHFSALQDGVVEQHYPINAVLHHAGNTWANMNTVGIEHEGGYRPVNEPLTSAQREASISLVLWIARQGGWYPSRTVGKRTLFEHTEVSDRVTQCPSGRIPWSAYLVQPYYTPEQRELLAFFETTQGQRLDKAERNRQRGIVGLPPEDTDPMPAEAPVAVPTEHPALDAVSYGKGWNDGVVAAVNVVKGIPLR